MRGATPGSLACWSVCFSLAFTAQIQAEEWEARGRVVDETGRPVADAAVGSSWRANGSARDRDGKPFDLTKEENVKLLWGNLGVMEPTHFPVTRTDPDGRFSLKVPERYHALMAMDRSRRRGGLGLLTKGDEGKPVEIRLAPLVRVRGSFEGPGAGQQPDWTHLYVLLPDDPPRPLDSTRLVSCGSFEAKFDVWLPPGPYVFQAYSQFADKEWFEGEIVPNREVVLKGDVLDVDLGRLTFSPHRDLPSRMREQKAKEDGTRGDYTRYYGKRPPRWHITDARGVGKDVQPWDFRGKWVLLDFWGFGCAPCLKDGLPSLMKFHEEHASQRDRFEILAICIDVDGEMKSMVDVDRRLEPIVRHVWGGKTLPFPVLLDSTFQTWERYGLPGLGKVLLIDPEGNLVEGDETVLAKKLKESRSQDAH